MEQMEKKYPIEQPYILLRCFDHADNNMRNELKKYVSGNESERIRREIL